MKLSVVALAGLLAATGVTTSGLGAAKAAANDPFNPKVTFTRSTDAARRDTRFYLKIDQADGEQQIGALKLSLPGAASEFLLDTDIPGVNYDAAKDDAGNNPAMLGTFHIEAYYSPNGNPARSTIALDGQVYDDNDAAGCSIDECVRVVAVVPVVNYKLNATLKIPHTATNYEVTADISSLWNESVIRQLDIRLKQLIVDLPAKKGTHTTFRNPTVAGTAYDFTYELRSAKIDALGHAGGASPACGAVCTINLPAVDYAPTAPIAKTPFNGQVFAAGTDFDLSWTTSTDQNLDAIGYVVTVDGSSTDVGPATTFHTGVLTTGVHTWSVQAVDSTGDSSSSPTYTIDIRSTANALVFTSVAVNTDKLYVFPGANSAFIYSLDGSSAQSKQYGARVNGLTETGAINYDGRFRFIALYAAPLKTAAGIFEPAAPRLLTGVGTGTTGA